MSEHAPDPALHGSVRRPRPGARPARPHSSRRVSCLDLDRPDGMDGDLEVHGRARDFAVRGDGTAADGEIATLLATVDYHGGRTLTRIATTPHVPRLATLVGTSAIAGFRGRVGASGAVPRSAPLALLLDDLPLGTLISGHAVSAAREHGDGTVTAGTGYIPIADQCAGYAEDGALITTIAVRGRGPVAQGPEAPPLDDAFGWTPEPLAVHSMRRRRRIDRWIEDDAVHIAAMFRDTYCGIDGVETVIHEYELDVVADADGGTIRTATATPRVLPWSDCPGAVASAGDLVGMTLADVESRVRRELRGVRTCTHLNDLLRSIGD
ncbi:DUF2889 domain-containing protein [Rhodococcus sp. SGAir0479]|uniref:DUF2889 domain-containing protein n=1 Tax=Rhodococcus sp. SGAir0479 TaxID=2567884 RepID=UPI0010CCDB1A|nr:DUF2889 domain-containing protein [Rhodococcus sp. SGAir0479]QCQ92913.1 DUF2889 domain-containing protein [Rhodococcus sp. SGAir0479]